MYLFLLIPPRGGSNLLYDIIRMSTDVVTMPLDEGEQYFVNMPTYLEPWAPCSCVHGFASRDIKLYRREHRYDWTHVREVWHNAWNYKDDDRIYLEKSPPNIFRYDMLRREFPNSKFIGMIRHPYGQIDSWIRHFHQRVPRHDTYACFYTDWVRHAEWLAKAQEDLGDDMLMLNYEDLIHDTSSTLDSIRKFIPALSDISIPYKLRDANEISISKYTSDDIDWINDAILDRTADTIERINVDRSLAILEKFRYNYFRENDLGDTDSRLFFTNKYVPNVQNERFFEYFKIHEDGLVHEKIPEWMEFFGLALKYYKIYHYKRGYLL